MIFPIADFAPLLYALATLSLACMVGLFVKFIAQLIPNLPIIGSSLRDAALASGESSYQWLIGQAHGAWTVAHDILTDVVWADKWITHYTVQCISHLGDQASHTWASLTASVQNIEETFSYLETTTIPNAIRAENDVVVKEIAATATSLQNNINTVVNQTIPTAVSDAVTTVDATISHVATSLQNNIDTLNTDVTNDLAQVWDSIDPLQTAVTQTLPAEITANAGTAAAATAAAAKTAQANLVTATQNLQSNLNDVQSGLEQSITASAAAAAALAQADLNTAEGVSAAQAAQSTITSESYAQLQLTTEAEALQQQIDQNTQQIDTLEATQTIALPQIYGITSPGTITVPLAVSALATEVVAISTEIGECMVTSCDGPNSLSNELQKLSGLFSTAGELSFVAAAVADPKGTADALADVVGGYWDTAHSLFDDLLSI